MRSDNPARRAQLCDWDGLIFGELGVLEGDGERVCCHACGRSYVHLGAHAFAAHGLGADVYKVIFGLNATTGLIGDGYRDRMRPVAQHNPAPYRDTGGAGAGGPLVTRCC